MVTFSRLPVSEHGDWHCIGAKILFRIDINENVNAREFAEFRVHKLIFQNLESDWILSD